MQKSIEKQQESSLPMSSGAANVFGRIAVIGRVTSLFSRIISASTLLIVLGYGTRFDPKESTTSVASKLRVSCGREARFRSFRNGKMAGVTVSRPSQSFGAANLNLRGLLGPLSVITTMTEQRRCEAA